MFLDSSELISILTCPSLSVHLLLDCRRTKSLRPQIRFRNCITISTDIQDEICKIAAKISKSNRKTQKQNPSKEGNGFALIDAALDSLSLEACVVLCLLWNTFVESHDKHLHNTLTHIVIMDDYVPDLPWVPLFSELENQQQQQQSVMSPYQSPIKAMIPNGRPKDVYGIATSYRRSPIHATAREDEATESNSEIVVKDRVSSWLPTFSATKASKSQDKTGTSTKAESKNSIATSASNDQSGEEIRADHAHSFASALVMLGFPHVSILQHNLLSSMAGDSSWQSPTEPSQDNPRSDSESVSEEIFNEMMREEDDCERFSESPITIVSRNLYRMRIPLRLLPLSFQTIDKVVALLYHNPSDSSQYCSACNPSENTYIKNSIPMEAEFILPVQFDFQYKLLSFVLRFLEERNSNSSVNEDLNCVRNVFSAEESEPGPFLSLKRYQLSALLSKSQEDKEQQQQGGESPHFVDRNSPIRESKSEVVDDEYLLIHSTNSFEGKSNSSHDDKEIGGLAGLFFKLQCLSVTSIGMQATLLATVMSISLMDTASERLVRAIVLLHKLLSHNYCQRSSLRHILRSSSIEEQVEVRESEGYFMPRVVKQRSERGVDGMVALIGDLHSIRSTIEASERVKKTLLTVTEKAQITSYRILQSKALTKYARNKVRSLFASTESTSEES